MLPPHATRWCAHWQLTSALSITTLIVALNISFPGWSDPRAQPLSTYQTRLPTIQFRYPFPKFLYLSYLDPSNRLYFKGNDDIYFVAFWVLVWLIVRELLMSYLWTPIALACRLKPHSQKIQRFTEQGWNLCYYSTFWSMGLKILSTYPKSILSLDIRQYWAGYPHDSLPGLTKFYYLSQTAFWFQQLIVLNIEKPRKDYYPMLAHHIVTIILVCVSYATNFTGLGLAIHTTMDFSDILLSLAKMLNYLETGWICDLTYTIFVFSWIYTRHYIFNKIILSIYYYTPLDLKFEWNPHQGKLACFEIWLFFLICLAILQLLLIFWLYLILKIMWGVIMGDGADDKRSDADDDEQDEMEKKEKS